MKKKRVTGEGVLARSFLRAYIPEPGRTRFFFNLLLPIFLLGFSASAMAKVVDKVVAIVNNDVITEYDLDRAMVARKDAGKNTRRQVLEEMVNDRLLKQEIDKANIEITDDDLARAIANVLQRNKINIEILRAELASKGISFDAYKDQLKEQIKQTKFIQQNLASNVSVKDEDVVGYKFERQAQVNPDGTVHLGWVFYPIDTDSSEKEIRKEVMKGRKLADRARRPGADFVKLAKETGDLGEKMLNELPAAVAATVRQMEVNSVSDPIVTPQGIYVVKLYEKSLQNISDKAKEDDVQIKQTIYNNRVTQEIDNYVMKLRRKAFVDIRE